MREIKFRAWDIIKKHWVYKEGYTLNEIAANGYQLKLNELEWVQYTGLKDKNGKEIYEGDIVKGYLMINDDDYSFTDVVSYKAPSFVCDNNADFGLDMYELEVIGNIYENPELLEAK